MIAEIKAAAKDGDSLGGTVEVVAYGVPVGLGSHVHWDRKLDGIIAQALMSIQAVKAVWIGEGFDVARRRGYVCLEHIRQPLRDTALQPDRGRLSYIDHLACAPPADRPRSD